MNNFEAHATVTINVPASTVWDALTNPQLVKQYMFGAEVVSDWQVGSTLNYRGEWQGKQYEDKGTILALEPNKLLKATYFSALSGREDKPENYSTVSYALEEHDGATTLTVTQDNNPSEESAKQSEQNWHSILDMLKKLLEQ